jgi:hypothetical protein
MSDISDVFGDVIHSYTRAQAIEDGSLIDVTDTARQAGFKWPVAVTAAVWGAYVKVPEGVALQDEAGRLWDVLWMAFCGIRRGTPDSRNRLAFQLHVRNDNRDRTPPLVTLHAHAGPGDNAEPVITIMLPDED